MRSSSFLLCLTGLHIGGGIAAVSRCIARALDEEVQAGRMQRTDRVLLLDDPADTARLPTHGEQHLAGKSQARFVWQTWRTFRRHRHDVVLFDFAGMARGMHMPLPGFPPPRMVVFVHSTELDTSRRARAVRDAQVLLVNSQHTADHVARTRPEFAQRIRVVPLCIDPARIALWEKTSDKLAPPERERVALIVGRMWDDERGKGHDELIAVWPAVRRRVPDAQLWVVGSGHDAPRLERKARDLGLGDAIRFFGRVSDEDLGALYQRASVFAMPSRQEGFGLVYAEAMWWGLPCIGSTADAAGQVIVAGETGELVPFGDLEALESALVHLLSDRERAMRMGEAGRRRAREFFVYERFRRDLLAALEDV